MLMPHEEKSANANDTLMCSEWTLQTDDFKSIIETNKNNHRIPAQNGRVKIPSDKNSYAFITFQDLYNQHGCIEWCDYNLQTIGLMKYVNGHYRLYPLLHKSDVFINLNFNTSINYASALDMYAKLYGFCLFYVDEFKELPVHPKDVHGHKLLMVFVVNCWIQLKDFDDADRLEKILYRINYK